MLPHHRRVSTALFEEIMKAGTTYHTDHLSLRITRMTAQHLSRFSVAVSKKIEKRAVDRNLQRRRLYSAVSIILSRIPPGYMGIFFPKKGFSLLKMTEIKEELRLLLEKALKISLL